MYTLRKNQIFIIETELPGYLINKIGYRKESLINLIIKLVEVLKEKPDNVYVYNLINELLNGLKQLE